MPSANSIPLVAHLIYRLDIGGMETLLVDCINRMPANQYRHAVICLTDYTDFAERITRPDVELIALHKRPGLGLHLHLQIAALLRKMRPAIVHTYNLAAVEYAFAAWAAGVPVRIHAEHGRDARDPHGTNVKHNWLRRFMTPFIDAYVPVSADLQQWLTATIKVPAQKNLLIPNGVDTERFKPAAVDAAPPRDWPFADSDFVIGTVGRVQDVKNHAGLVDAFLALRALLPTRHDSLKLAIIGDGPLMPALREKIAAAGLANAVWLPGARHDIAALMPRLSVFALSSIAEGTPVTVLEAMASGLPVVATNVGGIPEVIAPGRTGVLVPANDSAAMASALASYAEQPERLRQHGQNGRAHVEQKYSIASMLAAYGALYEHLCATKMRTRKAITSCAE